MGRIRDEIYDEFDNKRAIYQPPDFRSLEERVANLEKIVTKLTPPSKTKKVKEIYGEPGVDF